MERGGGGVVGERGAEGARGGGMDMMECLGRHRVD